MKDRLKELRKTLGLTQQEFADRIGISRGNVATYETREGNPGASVITLICREFNVNEEWLRTGSGDMFKQTEESAVSRLCAELHASDLEAGIIRAYFRIDPKIRDTFMHRLLEEVQAEYSTAAVPAFTPATEASVKYPQEMSDAELHTELDRQLAEEKKQAESGSVSGHGKSGTVAG